MKDLYKYWWFWLGVSTLVALTTFINYPLWYECRAQGFSAYYCFWQLK